MRIVSLSLTATLLWSAGALAATANPGSKPADAQPRYAPVVSLAEIAPGEDYGLKQPPVESPALLRGKRVAILAAHGVEDVELTFPLDYLTARGAVVDVVAPAWSGGRVMAVDYTKPTFWVKASATFKEALDQDYDLVLVTGGPWNSGVLRGDADALALIRRQSASGRLLSSICSGAQALIDAGLASGTELTGAPNIRIDLENAGATYRDQPVVVSGQLITGQDPRALPQYMVALQSALLGR